MNCQCLRNYNAVDELLMSMNYPSIGYGSSCAKEMYVSMPKYILQKVIIYTIIQ